MPKDKKHVRKYTSTVEPLGYIGGQDEHLGGFCEPLVIKARGIERFVLHTMWQYEERDRIKEKHQKVEFDSKEILLNNWLKVQASLGIDNNLKWIFTNACCGYDIPPRSYPL